jgi:segregation and condensation protein B
MNNDKLKATLEALICSADQPLSVNHLFDLFTGDVEQPGKDDIRKALHELVEDYQGRGMEIKQVASGFRLQVNAEYAPWITRLLQQKPPRYSRALLETLALIAYRQPITRGEIEAIRGVSVSSNIIKTLEERDWVKTLGHKDVPGKPSLYGTTSEFLNYFNLKSLNELPTLSEIKDLDQFHPELALNDDEPVHLSDVSDSETDPVEDEAVQIDQDEESSAL